MKTLGLAVTRLSPFGAVSALLYYQILVCCCQGFVAADPKPQGCDLLVAAASDLTDLERELSHLMPECKMRFTFGSSGLLRQQIRNGAPYDLFLSANLEFIKDLAQAGVIDRDTVHIYAYGQLALWSKAGVGWTDLSTGKVKQIAIANPTLAPYGKAAKEALQHEPQMWKAVESKLVYGENVRQAFQFAWTGNADACLTSYTLVQKHGGTLVDPNLYKPIAQAAGVTQRSGANTAAAKRLLNELLAPRGQDVFRRYGLLPVASSGTTERK